MPEPGPAIPGYCDLLSIGRGGLGDVYRARRVDGGEQVAIKLIRDISDSSQAWHRARRELTALRSLGGHPNVIQPIELIEYEGRPGLVMEYVAGGSLADLTGIGYRLSVDEVVFVGRQAATALAAAHRLQIVHRDLKPHNLMVDRRGQVKLGDFGIAAMFADDRFHTRTDALSARFASPEELDRDHDVGPPSDVYSLGATLLDLWRGTSLTLRDRVVAWRPPPETDPHAAALDAAIAACLRPRPSQRPSAVALLDTLDGLALAAGDRRVMALPVARNALERQLDEPTVPRRPARESPPPTARPAIGRRRPRRRLSALLRRTSVRAALLAAALVVAVLVGLRSGGRGQGSGQRPEQDDAAQSTAPVTAPRLTTVARPAGLPSLVGTDWGAGSAGECLVQVATGDRLEVVDCSEPHDLQRIVVGELSPSALDDGAPVDALVTAACDAALPEFVGSSPATTSLDIAVRRPSAAGWTAGDRVYQCYVGVDGARIVGDAEHSGW